MKHNKVTSLSDKVHCSVANVTVVRTEMVDSQI
jgi:hypothetical protein